MHQSPNSRWYSGAGIYRNVWLKKRGKNHIVTDGVYISTKRTDDGWQLLVDTELSLAEESQLTHTLIEIGGMALSRLLVTAFTIVRGRIMVAVGALRPGFAFHDIWPAASSVTQFYRSAPYR